MCINAKNYKGGLQSVEKSIEIIYKDVLDFGITKLIKCF
jgi:hypothetical protein